MQLVPQIEPITQMARDHKTLIGKLKDGPVVLSSHSKAAAVMVSVQMWNQPDAELTLDEFMADLS